MVLFVGLGNPGSRYAKNRHNVGFMAADRIHSEHAFPPWRSRFSGSYSEGRLGGAKVHLLKPETFMNLSGDAVQKAASYFKLEPDQIVVFYDELDLAPGKIKVKTGGGAAGHNGIRSISAHIGPEFRRVRLGIGHPGHKSLVQKHVLGDFAKADGDWLEPLLDAIACNAGLLAGGDDATFMNKVHLALQDSGAGEETAPTRGKTAPEGKASAPSEKDTPASPFAALRNLIGRR